MRNTFWTVYKQVTPPLIAMLILTLLVGGTVYQVTDKWEKEINHLTHELTQDLILSSIRFNLIRVDTVLSDNPEEAQKIWENCIQQAQALNALGITPEIAHLQKFLRNKENMTDISAILHEKIFAISVTDMQENLQDLQVYTNEVTGGVTLSMLILGLVLMAVTAWDLGKLFNDLARSRDLNISLQEEERRRVAQDLHDGVIQELIDLKRTYDPHKVDVLVENIRRICHNLKPQILSDIGLGAALEFLADELREDGKRKVNVFFEEEQLHRLPKEYELTLFRVVQELFNNVKRHAQATQVTLTMLYVPEESAYLRIQAQDNGVGFEPLKVIKGMGMTGVNERVHRWGGRMKVESAPGKGTRIQILIPIEKQ